MIQCVDVFRNLYYSCSQVMIFDRGVDLPGCDWTNAHFCQGFARRESSVSIRTLKEYGYANVIVHMIPFVALREYVRVIAVPFLVTSGSVSVEGPEESNVKEVLNIPSGQYRLVIAQANIDEENELIDLFISPSTDPSLRSEILLADEELNPPSPLVENADIAA